MVSRIDTNLVEGFQSRFIERVSAEQVKMLPALSLC